VAGIKQRLRLDDQHRASLARLGAARPFENS